MNNLSLIFYYTFLTIIIFFINELIMDIFDPSIQTRNQIHKMLLISFFTAYLIIPFKIIQGLIIEGHSIVKGNSIIILANKIEYIKTYTNFAYLTILLMFAVLFTFLFILFFDKRIMYRIYHLSPLNNKKIEDKLKKISDQININPPKLYIARNSLDVFTFGLKPKIAIGEDFLREATDKELEIVLKHELWHIKNKDIPLRVITLLLSILFFYNPLMFILIRKIDKESEYIADKCAMRTKEEKRLYIELMLKLNSLKITDSPENRMIKILPSQFPETMIKLDRNFSMDRIENLFVYRKRKIFLVGISVFLTFSLMSVGVFLGNFLAKEDQFTGNLSSDYQYLDTNRYSAYTEILEKQEYIIIHKNDFKLDKKTIEKRIKKLEYKNCDYELFIVAEARVFPEELKMYLKNRKKEYTETKALPEGNSTLLPENKMDLNSTSMDLNSTKIN